MIKNSSALDYQTDNLLMQETILEVILYDIKHTFIDTLTCKCNRTFGRESPLWRDNQPELLYPCNSTATQRDRRGVIPYRPARTNHLLAINPARHPRAIASNVSQPLSCSLWLTRAAYSSRRLHTASHYCSPRSGRITFWISCRHAQKPAEVTSVPFGVALDAVPCERRVQGLACSRCAKCNAIRHAEDNFFSPVSFDGLRRFLALWFL